MQRVHLETDSGVLVTAKEDDYGDIVCTLEVPSHTKVMIPLYELEDILDVMEKAFYGEDYDM